ncbi:casein kinase substrate phosphoprotein PP28-domain-containing protein [Aspergillus insuetus]
MAPRGRGGKFSKPSRGGGKRFSRDVQPVDKDGNVVGLWREPDDDLPTSSEEEEDSEEASSEEDEAGPSSAVPRNIGTIPEGSATQELTREERRALAKAKKAAAAARRNQGPAQPGDLPPSDSEDDDIAPNRNVLGDSDDEDLPANPNHTSKSRSQTKARADGDEEDAVGAAAAAAGGEAQLSRREREAIEAQQARERYMKLHAEGKTDEARADLARLALVKERREAERLRKEAEKEEKAELARQRAEEREKKFAKGPTKKKGKK